jgi:hypothetical protein
MPDTIPFAPIDPAAKLQADVAAFLADARLKAAGGFTVAEFGSLVVQLLRLCVEGLDAIPTDGAAKKAWALGIIGTLFDTVAGYAVPVYLQPFWFIAKPAIRVLVLSAASGALEQVLQLSRAAAAPTPSPA